MFNRDTQAVVVIPFLGLDLTRDIPVFFLLKSSEIIPLVVYVWPLVCYSSVTTLETDLNKQSGRKFEAENWKILGFLKACA